MDEAPPQVVPEVLWTYIEGVCHLPKAALGISPPDRLPAEAKRLLAHSRDMTSTLAEFHGSDLRVQILPGTPRE